MIPFYSEPTYRKVVTGKRVRYEQLPGYICYGLDTLPTGIHCIVVHGDGMQSYRYNVDPDHASVLGIMPVLREAMVSAMHDKNRYSNDSSGKPLTKKQRAVLDEYLRLRGESLTVFKGVSMHDVVEAGLKVLEDALASKG